LNFSFSYLKYFILISQILLIILNNKVSSFQHLNKVY